MLLRVKLQRIPKIKFDTVLARWLVCFHCKGSTIETADVAEWQTRSAQDAVGAILWRFKSSHPHQVFKNTPKQPDPRSGAEPDRFPRRVQIPHSSEQPGLDILNS